MNTTMHGNTLSGDRFSVEYRLTGTESEARSMAERLCADQTIEAPPSLLRTCQIPEGLLGRVEDFAREEESRHQVRISFPVELFGQSFAQMVHTLFGTASLSSQIQVADIHLPTQLPEGWPGPRHGIRGIRKKTDVTGRPLVCAVLKPLGLSPEALAELAHRFALGGVDIIKDDQGLGDHAFCPFDERVRRCVASIHDATRSTGRACLYFPHVVGSLEDIRNQAQFAKLAGADGILLSPGLVGYQTLHDLSRHATETLPIMSHPAFLGTYSINPENGLAPKVLYGRFPRLTGADITIYPTYGLNFPISRLNCAQIASACTESWGPLLPIFPTAAGRMGEDRIREMCELYGHDCVFILGSQIRESPEGIAASCEHFMQSLSKISAAY
ncbi:MAG: ribulose 1,5-bisphosphate carboxylase large subunit [Nitrospira sp. CG24D]|jgi:ribulose-bisphosphate carboxylase large chain|nr:MAG: ribulose 1,5-bisphosphate carboxylase large subunit [Nitrospira sp. CG24D]